MGSSLKGCVYGKVYNVIPSNIVNCHKSFWKHFQRCPMVESGPPPNQKTKQVFEVSDALPRNMKSFPRLSKHIKTRVQSLLPPVSHRIPLQFRIHPVIRDRTLLCLLIVLLVRTNTARQQPCSAFSHLPTHSDLD